MKIETIAGTLTLMLLVTTPALAGGGFIVLNTVLNQSLTQGGEYMNSNFADLRFVSGVRPNTQWNESLTSNIATEITDFHANFTDVQSYFALTHGTYTLQAGDVGGIPENKSVNLNIYVIMPDKFIDIQNIDMNFLMANLTQAIVTTNLTYKGKIYHFTSTETKEEDESNFNLALYPFCKEFEEAGLVGDDLMKSSFDTMVSSAGMDYGSSFMIQAVKD
jgi:hypothetical protein